uniref:Endonuclease domain-containing 1 protein-like n=1 Tax=Paramormyrops kingsleyae TaxID=1676925 RepID=A0A3B3SBX2_9TELE|nr:endonuclease domain-containing 1 protein-like [Paramormyrops kingsleyae]
MHVFVFFFILQTLPLTLQHVVGKFHDIPDCVEFFVNNKTPEISGILEGGKILDQNRYKAICQFYKNKYRFATLYDVNNKIPLFSAYKFVGKGDTKRKPEPWFIEPQLDDCNEKSMSNPGKVEKRGNNQALSENYKENNQVYHRGHLFPRQHANDQETADSTFTLTNAVPQYNKFNSVQWCCMEKEVTKLISEQCEKSEAYVVTGAVPGSGKLNNKVNIPELMWTAFCCKDKNSASMVGLAYYGENKEASVVEPVSVQELENYLKQKYGDINVFNGACPKKLTLVNIHVGKKRKYNEMNCVYDEYCDDGSLP